MRSNYSQSFESADERVVLLDVQAWSINIEPAVKSRVSSHPPPIPPY